MKHLSLQFLLALAAAGQTPYSRVAGGNPGPLSGHGVPATTAVLWTVEGLATDAAGNLFISQAVTGAGGGLVRRVDSAGIITTFASGSEFFYVNGLAFDTAGNLLVGDFNARRIIRVNSNGTVTVLAGGGNGTGNGPGPSLSLGRIGRLAVDRANNVYFTDNERSLVRRLSPDGIVTTIAGGGPVPPTGAEFPSPDGTPALQARLTGPNGIAVTPAGKVYFTDGPQGRAVRTIAPNGTLQTVAGRIDVFGGATCDNPPAGAAVGALFCEVSDLAIEGSGKLYITGRFRAGFTEHAFVNRIDPATNQYQPLVAVAGENGRGVTVDRAGNIYFSTWNNNNTVYRIPGPAFTQLGVQETIPRRYTGASPAMSFTFNHPGGVSQLGVVNALINTALDGDRACYVAYSRPLNVLYLVNDDGPASGLSAGLTPGGAGAAANSQCSLNAADLAIWESGNSLTLTMRPTFTGTFRGSRNIYLAARSVTEANSGWSLVSTVDAGAEAAIAYPRAEAISPNTINSAADTVVAVFDHSSAASGIQTAWLLINTAVDGRQACYVAYYQPGNMLYLIPDNGDGTLATAMPLAGNGVLENAQCRIEAAGSAASASGNRLTLQLNVTTKAGFAGPKGIWGAAQTTTGVTAGWRSLGVWRVP